MSPIVDRASVTGHARRWMWTVAPWAGIGLLNATRTVVVMRAQGMHGARPASFAVEVLAWVPWAAGTPLVVRTAQHAPLSGWRSLRFWRLHAPLAAAIWIAWAVWFALLLKVLERGAMGSSPFASIWVGELGNGILQTVLLYGAMVAITNLVESRERLVRQEAETARLNEQLSRARLDALEQQVQPHFLFNALHAISGLVREGRPDTAVEAIAELSDCLRAVLRGAGEHFVELGRELELVERYLAVQKLRFGDRVSATIEVPAGLRGLPVPALVLQPLVDNAIKHGLSRRVQGGTIRIRASRIAGALALTVHNTGPRLADESTRERGMGLANLRERLHALYGDAFELAIRDEEGGVLVSISIPYAGS
ncbi:MAG: sensor histidine kinase [Betaproteobacteria bacterium]